jgi:hypothetical protein
LRSALALNDTGQGGPVFQPERESMNKKQNRRAIEKEILADERKKNSTPEMKKRIAYHEAGHTGIAWMFGQLSDITAISMTTTLLHSACVKIYDLDYKTYCQIGEKTPSWLSFQLKRQMLRLLAGIASESRISDAYGESWLDAELDEDCWTLNEANDLNRAIRIAKAACGDDLELPTQWFGNKSLNYLRRMAAWTDEALAHPRLWAVVTALAEELVNVKRRMSGERACRIMEKAWGETYTIPYLEMGAKWERRFTVKIEGNQ